MDAAGCNKLFIELFPVSELRTFPSDLPCMFRTLWQDLLTCVNIHPAESVLLNDSRIESSLLQAVSEHAYQRGLPGARRAGHGDHDRGVSRALSRITHVLYFLFTARAGEVAHSFIKDSTGPRTTHSFTARPARDVPSTAVHACCFSSFLVGYATLRRLQTAILRQTCSQPKRRLHVTWASKKRHLQSHADLVSHLVAMAPAMKVQYGSKMAAAASSPAQGVQCRATSAIHPIFASSICTKAHHTQIHAMNANAILHPPDNAKASAVVRAVETMAE